MEAFVWLKKEFYLHDGTVFTFLPAFGSTFTKKPFNPPSDTYVLVHT